MSSPPRAREARVIRYEQAGDVWFSVHFRFTSGFGTGAWHLDSTYQNEAEAIARAKQIAAPTKSTQVWPKPGPYSE